MAPSIIANGHTKCNSSIHTAGRPGLRIIIVGGGIGGLSAAIALRHQGHHVKVYEQSRFASEVGAAIHMTPNATGALKYLGVNPKDAGAVPLELTRFFSAQNEALRVTLNNSEAYRWQDGWLLAHRAHLHTQLKDKATDINGPGEPVELITSSQVSIVDPQTATITLSDGTSHSGDVIIGADGVHSKARTAFGDLTSKPFKGLHNAFRFTISREIALTDPQTEPLVNINGSMDIWYDHKDRKIVLYSTTYNKTLNFVCVHPAELSVSSDSYQKAASKERLLEVYAAFHPSILKLLSKVDPKELNIYPLWDMDTLPSYVSHRLALIGDAAHPFTPHLAQGGAMAIEDGVSLGVLLDSTTAPDEVVERLQLYDKARYERSSVIQNYSRIVGGDAANDKTNNGQDLKVHDYIDYGFSHNESHASSQLLKAYKWGKLGQDLRWRQPTVFGPLPGPRQDSCGKSFAESLRQSTRTKTSVKFATSATLLRNLFPSSSYSFERRDTVAYASFCVESLDNLAWLAGGGYDTFALYIHDVCYKDTKGQIRRGTYLPIMIENLADAITTGREELGYPKLFSDINVSRTETSVQVSVSWRGVQWASLELKSLKSGTLRGPEQSHVLVHKYIPSTGGGKADADYDVLIRADPEASQAQSTLLADPVNVRVDFNDAGSQKLPTLHSVVEELAKIPIFDIVEATVTDYQGVSDLSMVERLS